MTAGDESLTAGLVAAATLIVLSFAVAYATYRWRWFERASEGEAAILIRDGQVNPRVMRAERITQQELEAALHKNNIASATDVAVGFVEPSDDMTFIEKPRSPDLQ